MIFRPSPALFSKSVRPSSRAWIARQSRDHYVKKRAADPAAFRARSAFKLVEMDEQCDEFLSKPDVQAIVDLGAAPGGWSQVVAQRLGWWGNYSVDSASDGKRSTITEKRAKHAPEPSIDDLVEDEELSTASSELDIPAVVKTKKKFKKAVTPPPPEPEEADFDPLNIDDMIVSSQKGRGTIVAVDLLRMAPIPGVNVIQADFLAPDTEDMIHSLLSVRGNMEGKADIILSDMAANATGNVTKDVESSLEICEAVFTFAKQHLRTAESIGRRKGGVLLYVYLDSTRQTVAYPTCFRSLQHEALHPPTPPSFPNRAAKPEL
ncbi:hypothetical protein AX16_007870 [Volvariella volvacea WC 439]|nr:hypothetical protein AX16_007870 [Volvariella volvacea WC 439]